MSAHDRPDLTATRLTSALAGRYRIERELGHGGMATVYLAQDLKHERQVAIKVLHPELGAWLGAERFLSEIRITARLQHPHILPLLDSGDVPAAHPERGESSLLYYVMPFVAGETLRARLRREQLLPVEDATRIAKELASALAYAHAQGIIHRDIKPENVLLGVPNVGSPAPVLLADFGIARSLDSTGERLTGTGVSVGTVAYMSPEQATGERELDGRSDIYSLGCVVYEMLAGEPPFTGPNPRAILAKALSEPVRSLRRIRDGIPPHIDAALATALGRSPADRFADAAAFAAALDTPASVDSAAGAAVADDSRHASRPLDKRLVAGGVGVLAVAAATWATLRSPREALALPSVRIERFTMADTGSAYLAATLQQDVTSALQESHSARIFSMDSARLPSGYAVQGVASRLADAVEVRLTVVREPSGEVVGTPSVRQPLGRAEQLPQLAANTVLRLVTGRAPSAANATQRPSTRDSLAYDYFLRGRFQTDRRTEASTRRAVQFFRAAIERDSSFAEGWAGLARALEQAHIRRFRIPPIPQDSILPIMLDASERALDADSTRSYVWIARAMAIRELEPAGRRNQIAALERAIRVDSTNADAWHYLGVAWEDSLEPTRALAAWRHALRIDPTHRQALGFMSLHFMWARQYDSARVWGDSGKRIDPTHILIRQGLGMTGLLMGDTTRAADDFRAEIRVANGPDEGFGWAGLADIALRRGDRVAADTLLRHAVAFADTIHPSLHEAAYIAWGYAALGDRDRAVHLLERYEPRADIHFQLHLQRDPLLDPLRAMPAFRALLVRKDAIRAP